MFKLRKITLLLLVILMIGGYSCATTPVPQTINQKIAYSKATVIGLNNSIVQLLNAKIITLDEAKKYRNITRKVRALLNATDNYISLGEIALATKSWSEVNQILLELNKILLEKAQTEKK